MLTEEELMERLREYGKRFKNHISEKEWDKAKNIYNIALEVSVFMQISKEHMDELFGAYTRDDTPLGNGIFRKDDVMRVGLECCIRRNRAYEDQACRKRGIPLDHVQYYSDREYCARCGGTGK